MYLYNCYHSIELKRTKSSERKDQLVKIEKVRRKKEELHNSVFQAIAIEAVTRKCSLKEVFSKILEISQENTCAGAPLATILIKWDLGICFSMSFMKLKKKQFHRKSDQGCFCNKIWVVRVL